MGWLSILPDHLSGIETWIVRIFVSHLHHNYETHVTDVAIQLLLGIVTIGPWALLLVYDVLYYFWRTAAYEIPVFGGRAKGKRRPRAPSLTERPSGDKRKLNVPISVSASGSESQDSDGDMFKRSSNQQTAVDGG